MRALIQIRDLKVELQYEEPLTCGFGTVLGQISTLNYFLKANGYEAVTRRRIFLKSAVSGIIRTRGGANLHRALGPHAMGDCLNGPPGLLCGGSF